MLFGSSVCVGGEGRGMGSCMELGGGAMRGGGSICSKGGWCPR